MTNIAMKRVNREFLELHKGDDDSKKSFHIEPKNNDMLDLKGHIIGPVDTPFEGGTFKLELKSMILHLRNSYIKIFKLIFIYSSRHLSI